MTALPVRIRGARQWLDENLFPDAPTPPALTGRRAAVIGVVAVLGIIIQLVRIRSSAPLDSLWAEDGYVWLADALRWGFLHAVTTPYNGYLNTVSRLVAGPVSTLPPAWFASGMALSGAAIVTGCAFFVWRATAGHITSPYLRATLFVATLVLPVVGIEMLDDVTYSIWYLLFASFWALLWRPASKGGAVGVGALLLLTALSNALVILLLPLWLLRVLAARDRRDKIVVASYALGVVLQYAASWNQRGLIGEPGSYQYSQPGGWHWNLFPAYLQRAVGGALTGQRFSAVLWTHLGGAFELVLSAAVVTTVVTGLASRRPGTRLLVPLTVAISLTMFLVAGFQRQVGAQFYWPKGLSNVIGSHYMVVPVLLFLSAVVLCLDGLPAQVSRSIGRGLQFGVVGVVLASVVSSFGVFDAAARGHPTWTAALSSGRTTCERTTDYDVPMTIAPGGDNSTAMKVPCRLLIGAAAAGRRPPAPDPHARILIPAAGTTISGRQLIAIQALDTVTVTTVRVFLHDPSGRVIQDDRAEANAFVWVSHVNTDQVAGGPYWLQSVAVDSAGKRAVSPPVPVRVENRRVAP